MSTQTMLRIVGSIAAILLIRIVGSLRTVRGIERLQYTVIEKKIGYEIRQYPSYIAASVTVDGTGDNANNDAFRLIAGYIFGGNKSKQSVAMTTPVMTQTSQPIAMTSPVLTTKDATSMTMTFVMPSKYTLETLPTPNNDRVKLIQVPGYKAAVYRFGGGAGDAKVEALTKRLEGFLVRDSIQAKSDAMLLRFDPPRTFPFLKHNELVIRID